MNQVVLHIAIIFIPGIIWATLISNYSSGTKPTKFRFILNSFLSGAFIYITLDSIARLLGFDYHVSLLDNISDSISTDILLASILAVIFSIIWLAIKTHKCIDSIFQFIKCTQRDTYDDEWLGFFDRFKKERVGFVHIRDFSKQLTYAGYVLSYSSRNEASKKIIMRDVIIYNFEGTTIYESPLQLVCIEGDNFTIEVPKTK